MPRFPALESFERLIGCNIDEADEAAIDKLVGAEEGQGLDFKRETYDLAVGEEKDELCKDVVAMANATGGILVLGMAEASGAASKFLGVTIDEKYERRVAQTIEGRVSPQPHGWAMVPTSGSRRGYLLVVPPSDTAHLGFWPDGDANAKRFPLRVGRDTFFMSESQIADRYRSRLSAAEGQARRVDDVTDEALDELRSAEARVWMVLTVVPAQAGARRITHDSVDEAEHWYRTLDRLPFAHTWHETYTARVAFRRVVIRSPHPSDPARSARIHLELHSDGSSVVALELAIASNDRTMPAVHDDELAEAVVAAAQLGTSYAVNLVQTGGDAAVRAQLFFPLEDHREQNQHLKPNPISLMGGSWFERPTAMSSAAPLRVSADFTISLDEATRDAAGLLASAGLIAEALFQHLGLVDAVYLGPDGSVRVQAWHAKERDRLRSALTPLDVVIDENSVPR